MFKTIMWASDGTENADLALSYVKALAHRDGANVLVAHVVERYATHEGLAVHPDEQQVEGTLQQRLAEMNEEGLTAQLRIVNHVGPQPAHQLAELAREAEADLIVMGCRGHSAVTGLMLGSVTQRLLHVSPCPVLAVPHNAPVAERHVDGKVVETTV